MASVSTNMSDYWVLSIIFSYFLSTGDVADGYSDGVCERERLVPRSELEYYTERIRCAYYENCWSHVVHKTKTRIVTDIQTDTFCCSGYKLTGYSSGRPQCAPECLNTCVHGTCVAPGTCECLPGFGRKKSDHICEPVCDPECVNAECVRDNQCSCYPGFNKDQPHNCTPHCSHGCANGYCALPEACACNASYSLSSNGTVCLPVCTLECENGKCVSPDRCECNAGYVESRFSWNLCEPYCTKPCENAVCAFPEVCTCLNGYVQQNDGGSYRCVPHCSKKCIDGECIAPEECGCNEGFDMDPETQLCVPVCSYGCDNGRCVSPEKCDCDAGYKNLNGPCIPSCDNDCINGNCTGPNECTCNNGTLKASSFHCLITCGNTTNDECYHRSLFTMASPLIQIKDDDPYVDFPEFESLSVPCKNLSPVGRGNLESYYECYTYLSFEDESLTVVCSVDTETMASSDRYNQTQNLTTWMANATSMESQFMNVLFVHREVSRYCTAYLCQNSNRTLHLNGLSNIRVCMEQHTSYRNTEWPSWLTIMICLLTVLLVVLVIAVALRYYTTVKKVSYTVNTRHHSTSSQCGILVVTESSENIHQYEQMESVELSNELDNTPMISK